MASVVLLGACFRARGSDACVPVPDEVVKAAGMPVFAGCQVDTPVGTTTQRDFISFMPQQLGRVGCFVVVVEFVVDPAGLSIPATQRVRQSSDANMLRLVLATVNRTQYLPATKGGRPVAQLIRERKTANLKYWRLQGYSYVPEFDDFPC